MHDVDKLRAVAHPGTERVFTAAEAKGLSLFMLRAVLSGWGDESSTWRR